MKGFVPLHNMPIPHDTTSPNIPSPLQVLLHQAATQPLAADKIVVNNSDTNPATLNIITGKTQQPLENSPLVADIGSDIGKEFSKAAKGYQPVSYSDYLKPVKLISSELNNVKTGLDVVAAPFQGVYDAVIKKHAPKWVNSIFETTGLTPHQAIPFFAMMALGGGETDAVSTGSKLMDFIVNEGIPLSKKMGIATAVIDSPTLQKSPSDYIDDIGVSMIAGMAMGLVTEYVAKPSIHLVKTIGDEAARVAKDTLSKAQDKSTALNSLINWVTDKVARLSNTRGITELAAPRIKSDLFRVYHRDLINKTDNFMSRPDVISALKDYYQYDEQLEQLENDLASRGIKYNKDEPYKLLAYQDGFLAGTHPLSANFKEDISRLELPKAAEEAGRQAYHNEIIRRAEKVSKKLEQRIKQIDTKYLDMVKTLKKVKFKKFSDENYLKDALNKLGSELEDNEKVYLYKRSAIENDYKNKLMALNEEAKTNPELAKNKLKALNKTYQSALKELDTLEKRKNYSQWATFYKRARLIAKEEKNRDLENYLRKAQEAVNAQINTILKRRSAVLDRLAQRPITQAYFIYNNPSLAEEAKLEDLANILNVRHPSSHISYTEKYNPLGTQKPQTTTIYHFMKEYFRKNPNGNFKDVLIKTLGQEKDLAARYENLDLLKNYKINQLHGGLAEIARLVNRPLSREELIRLGKLPVVGTRDEILAKLKFLYPEPEQQSLIKDTFKDLYSETQQGLSKVYYTKNLENWFNPEEVSKSLNAVDTINQFTKSLALVGSPFHAFTLLKSALYSNTPLSLDDLKMVLGTIIPLYPKSFMDGIDETNSKLAKRILDIAEERKINILATPGRSEFSKGTDTLTRELFGEESPASISQSIKDGKYGTAIKSIFKTFPSKQERMLWDGLYRRLKLEATLQELTSNRPIPEIETRLNNINKFFGGLWQYMYNVSPGAKSFLRFVFLAPDFFTAGLARFVQAPTDAQLLKYLLIEHTFNFMMNAGGRGLLGQDPESLKNRWENWLSDVSKFRNPYEFFEYVNGVPTRVDTAGYEMEIPRIAEGIARDIYLKNMGHIPNTLLKNYLSKASMVIHGITTLAKANMGITKQEPLINEILSFNFLTSSLPVEAIGKIPNDQLAPLFLKYLLFNSTGSRMYMLSPKAIRYTVYNLLTQHHYNDSTMNTLNAFVKASHFKDLLTMRQGMASQWCLENFGKNYERKYTNAVNKYMQGKESSDNVRKSIIEFARQYQTFYNGLSNGQKEYFLTPIEFANYILKKAETAAKRQIRNQNDMFIQPSKPAPEQTVQPQPQPQSQNENWNADKTFNTAYQISNDPQTAAFITAIAQVESSQNPNVVNASSKATGLMQFLPSTAKEYNINPRDPVQSIQAAIKYLNKLINQTGSVQAALYDYSGHNPNYVAKVLTFYREICYQKGINP